MSLTSRKRRPLDRTTGALRDARLIVIATEGEKTESQYFEFYGRRDHRVQLILLPSEGGFSAPIHVIKRLKEYKDKFQFISGDEFWLVFDVDRWPSEQIRQVCAEARQQHFKLAVSNPCFEIWLYFHLGDFREEMKTWRCRDSENEIRRLLGSFNPANIEMEVFNSHTEAAVTRAHQIDEGTRGDWPDSAGSRAYRVIQSIKNLR